MKLTILFQKLEAVAMLITTLVIYQHLHFGWWLLIGAWIVFDVSMLGYAINNRIGAVAYNLVHSFIPPAALIILGITTKQNLAVQIALIELTHITLDRSLGYGLKEETGFQHTHLGLIGKR